MARHSCGGRRGGGRTGSAEGGSSSSANTGCRRHQGTNLGLFGRRLAVPHTYLVDVDSHHILTPEVKGTIHAICLSLIPVGCMRFTQYAQYDPSFMENVMREFHTYYRFEEGVSTADGDAVILTHIAKNYFRLLYEMRERAARDVEEQPGSTLRDHPSQHVSDAVWAVMCAHSDDESFKKKSEQMKKNRGKLQVVHTTGSQSFVELKSPCILLWAEPPPFLSFGIEPILRRSRICLLRPWLYGIDFRRFVIGV